MTSQLQRLRRDAGYRTAADFADKIGIPSSTYCRYERGGAIPTANAVLIADALHVSVDAVLGREQRIDACIDIAERIGALPEMERAMLTEYLDFLESRAFGC